MVQSEPMPQRRRQAEYAWGVAIFILITAAGLYYAKWDPYYHKAFLAAARHSLGASIVAGKAAAPPTFGWQAAWQYAIAYGKAIWEALVVGLLVGSGVQALLPGNWLRRVLGRRAYSSTAIAGAASIPSMM